MSKKSFFKKVFSFVMSLMLIVSMGATTAFAANTNACVPTAVMTASNKLTFKNLKSVQPGESVEFNIIDSEGNPATIGVERVVQPRGVVSTNAASNSWKVYYTGITINCHFYMTVTNNKVTSVYNDWILIIGGTFHNASLTRTSTYGKQSFKVEAYAGVMAATCWLKGTVTGSGNNINVTWRM